MNFFTNKISDGLNDIKYWIIDRINDSLIPIIDKIPSKAIPSEVFTAFDYIFGLIGWFDQFLPLSEMWTLTKMTLYITAGLIILGVGIQTMRIFRIWKSK